MPDQNGIYDFSGFTKRENDDEPLFTPLPTIMEQASQQSPQEFARSLTLSQQTGIPAEAVRGDIPAVESVAKAQQYDFSGLVKRSPATGQFLNDYNNAVLAQNDVPVLERIERLASTLKNFSTGALLGKATGLGMVAYQSRADVARSVPAGAIGSFAGVGLSGVGTAIEVGGRTLARTADMILPEEADRFIWGSGEEGFDPMDPAAYFRFAGGALQDVAERIGPAEEDRNIATEIGAGVGQMVGQVLTYMFAPQVAVPALFASGVEQQRQRQEQTGTVGQSMQSDQALILGGIATLVTEKAGIDQMLERIPPNIKNATARAVADVFIAGGIEGLQEVVEGVAQGLIEQSSTNINAEILEGAADEATVGFGVGAIVRSLILTATPGKLGQAAADQQIKGVETEQQQQTLEQLNELAQQSELRQLSPEAFSQFIRGVDGDSDSQVYVDGAQLSLYLQEQGRTAQNDPALILLADRAGQSAITGTAVNIPIQEFMTVIAGTQHFDALRDSMTLTPDAVAPFRQEQQQQEAQSYMRRLVEEAQQNTSQYVEAQEIYESVRQQLVDTGMVSDRNARVMAQLVPAWAASHAQQTGKSVAQVYAESGLTIVGPQTGRMAELQGEQVLTQARETGYRGVNFDEALQWRAAVQKFGPEGMTTEARMARAREMGFDTEQVFLHATADDITEFDQSRLGTRDSGFIGRGVYTAPVEASRLTDYYARTARGEAAPNVMPLLLKEGKYRQFTLLEKQELAQQADPQFAQQLADDLAADGFIGAEVVDGTGQVVERVVFDPANIRSVNAAFDPDAADSADLLAQPISTRVPFAKKPKEDHMLDHLSVGIESITSDKKFAEKIVDTISKYSNYKPPKGTRGVEAKLDAFIEHVTDNLLWLYDQVDVDTRERSKLWYEGANRIANEFSTRYNISVEQVAAVMASLSPQKDWFQNVSLAERVIDIAVTKADNRWSDEMTETAKRIFGKPQYADMLKAVEGKTLREIDDTALQALWIRTYDQTFNTRSYRLVSPEGIFQDIVTTAKGAPANVAWGSLNEIAKAVSVIKDGSIDNISLQMGQQHKVRNFYNNIFDPGSDNGSVTIDTHAVAAGLLKPLSGNSTEVGHNFGAGAPTAASTGNIGTYGVYAEAYRRAAERAGVLPREMQSITWEAVRQLFPAGYKSQAKNVKKIESLWSDFKKDKLTLDEVRNEIQQHTGGVTDPSWAGSPSESDGTIPDSSYQAELPGDGLRGQTTTAGSGVGSSASRGIAEPLAQGGPNARGYYDPQNAIIRLTEAADLSTFLHEFAHFMFEMERTTGGQNWQQIGEWFKRNAADVAAEANGYLKETGSLQQSQLPPGVSSPNAQQFHESLLSAKQANPERAARIAAAYDAMKHDPQNPEVMAAYEAMIQETIDQYQAALDAGLKVDFIDFDTMGDPYAESPRAAIEDIVENNHMWVFSTRDGFGSDDTFDPVDNPLLRETEFEISGQKALVNDLFRVVHDYFGHAKEGVGFRAGGEENAWRAHSAMYSPLARKAMTTETRGQNSWVNFGPYGETNRTASAADTHYADQKIGLLPDWAVTEGAGDTDVYLSQEDAPGQFEGPITPEDVNRYVDNGTTGNADKDQALYRATHEQFARGWEKYLMEGKAPSNELRSVFRTFARWLARIYDGIKNSLKVNLDDGIRQVFDRLIATEEQIAAAEARGRVEPLFTDAAMAGMTEEEFAKYQQRQQDQKDKAAETLREKMIKQLTRHTEQWWRRERDDMAVEEAQRLQGTRTYRAVAALRDGEMKLDKAVVKEMVGEQAVSRTGTEFVRLPSRLRGMTIDGARGVHPDEAAAFLGYGSGQEMLMDMIMADPINKVAQEAAQQRMIEKHGDILNDGSIEQEADAALQNEERAELLLTELKALTKGTSAPAVDRANIKAMAEESIGRLSYRDIHPGKYRSAEIRAAQEAVSELAKGDKDAAARAKMRQVMNFYLGKAATEARAQVDKIVDDMSRYSKKSVREQIMKAQNGYWEQIERVLNRFEFRKSASMKSVDRVNQDINTWAAERISEDGDGLVLSNAVTNESYVTHWKNVPVADLQGIADSIRNIEHVARYSNKINLLDEQRQFEEVVTQLTDSIDSKVKSVYKPQRSTVAEKKSWGKWAMAQMTKIGFLTSWLDGGERVGLAHQLFFQPFTDSLNERYKKWEVIAEPVIAAISERTTADKKRHMQKVHIPEIADENNDGNLYGHQILAVALNTGNQGNLRKMLLGEGWAEKDDDSTVSIDNPKLQAVLKHMTARDWNLVQLIWDQMDKLYPELAEVHRRTTGLTPPKVESTPFSVVTRDGETVQMRGGYYPVKYDPNRSQRAEMNEQRQQAQVDSMFATDGSIQASVNASATSERTGYYAPIRLSLDVVPNHFHEVIHYITHHDAVRQVNKLIRNKQVADSIKAALGPDEFAQLRPWLNDIAKDGRETPNKTFIDSAFAQLRFGLTLGVMGFKASTGIIQISGLSNAVSEVGMANMSQALRSILASEQSIQQAWEFARDNSKVLAHRTKTMDREIRSALETLEGKRGFAKAVQEASMKHIAYIQTYMVDLPSWYAGYIKELKSSGDEKKAYQYADWVVEQVQGSGATKDMAGLLRSQTGTHRLFTMFMTFFSSLWNMERDLARGARGNQYSTTDVAAKLMFLFTIPVLFEMFLRGELGAPDDEDEDVRIQNALSTTAMYAIGGVPFARDIANAVVGDFGYSMTPVAQVLEAGVNAVPELISRPLTDEEITKGQVKGATRLAGAFLGVPGVSQVWGTGEHLYQVLEDGEEFTVRELLFGPSRE